MEVLFFCILVKELGPSSYPFCAFHLVEELAPQKSSNLYFNSATERGSVLKSQAVLQQKNSFPTDSGYSQ